jgi:hypothetical protein
VEESFSDESGFAEPLSVVSVDDSLAEQLTNRAAAQVLANKTESFFFISFRR